MVSSRILLLHILMLAGCGAEHHSAGAVPAASKSSSSPVVMTPAHTGLRCALSRMYLYDDYTSSDDPLRKRVFASPDGKHLALLAVPGARVFDFERGAEYTLSARPVSWSSDSHRLYLLGTDRKFYSWADGQASAEPWLDHAFDDTITADSKITFGDFIVAGDGLIAMTKSAGRIDVFNTVDRSRYRVYVGARWRSLRAFSQLLVGWNSDRSEPALFVAHQDFDGSLTGPRQKAQEIEIENRIDVYRPNGEHAFGAQTTAGEAAFLPLLANQRVPLIARQREFRCLTSIDAQGALQAVPDCSVDLDNAYLDREGHVMATREFTEIWPRTVQPKGMESAARQFVATLSDGSSLFLVRDEAAKSDGVWRMKSGVASSRIALAGGQCPEMDLVPRGEPVDARLKDGFPAHGFLFRPSAGTPIRGLIVSLHGGPYGVAYSQLARPFEIALLKSGYAIANVNYRGSAGYGRAVLEKAYGGDWPGMIDDAEGVRSRALEMLGLPAGTRTILHGVSYGGFIAIRAALDRRTAFQSYLVEAGACSLGHELSNFAQAGNAVQSLASVSDPSRALHGLRIATRADGRALETDLCGRRLPDGTRMVVIHAKDDPNVPFVNIRRFLDAQDRKRSELFDVISDAGGHNLMTAIANGADPEIFRQVTAGILGFLETGTPPVEAAQ